MSRHRMCIAALAIAAFVSVVDATQRNVRICHIPARYTDDGQCARHALFSTKYLSTHFRSLNVSFAYATIDGGPNIRSVAQGLLARGAECDAFVGPQWSSVAVGINALVNVPWVSHAATAKILSDKDAYPWFSRAMPTDDFGGAGMAAVASTFGWEFVSVLCVDDAYGHSLLAGFRSQHNRSGGAIDFIQCLTKDAAPSEATAAMRALARAAFGRVVVVAGEAGAAVMDHIVDAAVALGMHRTHAFIFSASACASRWERLRDLPGAFCVSYAEDPVVAEPYAAAWRAHDPAALFGHLPALGVAAPADPFAIGLYDYLMHDSVLALLHAFNATSAAGGAPDVRSVLRSQRIAGSTGAIALDAAGDRIGARVDLVNVVPVSSAAGSAVAFEAFATWSPLEGTMISEPVRERYWLAAGRGPPPDLQPADAPAGFVPSPGVLIALLGFIIVVSLIVVFLIKIGCSDANVVARLVHSGVAGAFVMGVLDATDAVISVIAAVDVAQTAAYSQTFKICYLSLSGLAFVGAGVDITAIIAFIHASLKTGGRLTPGKQKVWHLRLAVGACISLALEDLPLLGVAFAAITLNPHNVTSLVLTNFIFSSIIAGAKILEPRKLLAHAVAPSADRLHRQIEEKFPMLVPLTRNTPAPAAARVRRYIARLDAKRDHDLLGAAKHIVVDCQNNAVSVNEFLAVVWRSMATMYATAIATDEDAEIGTDADDVDQLTSPSPLQSHFVAVGPADVRTPLHLGRTPPPARGSFDKSGSDCGGVRLELDHDYCTTGTPTPSTQNSKAAAARGDDSC